MCFHTIQNKLAVQIERRFMAEMRDKNEFVSRQEVNGFTFPKTPVITNEYPEIIEFYNWGLIPNGAKDDHIKSLTLNARVETVYEKPSFRDVVSQRCLVIANGFYEWQWLDSKGRNKVKYKIGIDKEELFAFAGLYSH
jgi:putative SOS response-associated peptidase YedK